MYNSLRLLSQQLVKAREQVFQSKKVVRNDFFKIVAIGGCIQLAVCLIVEEFGVPTPDICYDTRINLSPEFCDYVKNGEYSDFDMSLNSVIRSYKIEQGHISRTSEQKSFSGSS
uniref:Innexin n=1 Tax=Strongyloides venezuelensis TaxID=75913 RepID=A0A0K0F5H4_STRVS